MPSVNEIYQLVNEYAPKALSDEFCQTYDAYDNSGILVDTGEKVERILCSLDFSLSAVRRAVEIGAKLIITHHPAIYGKIGSLRESDALGNKLLLAAKHGISVISMHLNLDCAKEGIDEYLMRGVKRAAGVLDEESKNKTVFAPLSVTDTGYGRGYLLGGVSFAELTENIKKEFATQRVVVYGKEKKIDRCASFCGAGADDHSLAIAEKFGADVIVSSDFKHHILAQAVERGINVIALTHYAAENYGFQKIMNKLLDGAGLSYEYHTDEDLL